MENHLRAVQRRLSPQLRRLSQMREQAGYSGLTR